MAHRAAPRFGNGWRISSSVSSVAKKVSGQRIVVGITHGAHGGRDLGLPAPPSEGQAGVLCALVGVLNGDSDRARALLERLVGTITLRPVGSQLVGSIQGNLAGLVDLDVMVAKSGAGRGI